MKLHIMSDLHLSGCGMKPLPVLADALILAGDISDGIFDNVVELTEHYRKERQTVLYVPGNHEFEGHEIAAELRSLHRKCSALGITLLYNRGVDIKNVRFLGTTLWTDFSLGGKPTTSMRLAQSTMCDFSRIKRVNGRRLTPEDTVRFHHAAVAFLERSFAKTTHGATVLITHHAVSPRSIHSRHQGDSLNAAYATDLEERLLRWAPTLAIHGHVHRSFDYRIGETRVIANPRGRVTPLQDYDGSILERLDNDDFDPNLVIEVR